MKPGYKQTEIGVIPADWDVQGLLDVVRIAKGQVNPKIEPYRSMPLVAPDHIESGTGRLIEIRTAEEQRAISGKYLFGPDDIVYSKIRPYLRKAILANFAGLCSADMYPLTPIGETSGRFILESLLAYRFTKYAEAVSVRSGMPKINRSELADFQVAVPNDPLEQRAISATLADVDAAVAASEQLIGKKRDIKQATMQQLLTGETRLPGFSRKWEVRRLGDHITFLRNGTLARAQLTTDEGVCYLHYGDIHGSSSVFLSPSTGDMPTVPGPLVSRLDRMEDGDLVFADASEDLEGVGKSVEIQKTNGREAVSGLHTIAARFKKDVLADGFKGYLQFIPAFSAHLRKHAAGTKVLATNRSHIASAELELPTPDEQKAIAVVFNDIDVELSALEAQRDKTLLIKQAMMQELLTGRTRLSFQRDVND
ncbi:restriction endonuclease subunit S [Rhizobium ruizarguesonis]